MDLAKKVFGKAGSSTHKLQQLAASADDKQLAVIPHKYWKAVRSLSKVDKTLFYLLFTMLTLLQAIEYRNEAAHESEIEFARLLILEGYKDEYHFWKDAFPLLYGGSIEEVAARKIINVWDS